MEKPIISILYNIHLIYILIIYFSILLISPFLVYFIFIKRKNFFRQKKKKKIVRQSNVQINETSTRKHLPSKWPNDIHDPWIFRPIRIWNRVSRKKEKWGGGRREWKFFIQFNDVREIRTFAKRVDVVSGVVGRQCRGTRDAEKWKQKWKLRERRASLIDSEGNTWAILEETEEARRSRTTREY